MSLLVILKDVYNLSVCVYRPPIKQNVSIQMDFF